MAGKVLSIEVGYSFTKVCELDYQSKKTKIYNSFVLPTPDGILADGMLTVDEGFVAAFKEKLAEKKIKTKAAVFTISSSKIATREVKIPYCKENRIGDLVRANLQDYFPIDVSQYMVAHSILEVEGAVDAAAEGEDSAKKKASQPTGYKLLLLAVPSQVINGYRLFASALGLEVKEVDYNGNSIYQAAKEECGEGTQMIVKIDERSSLLLVQKDGVIVLNRTIPYGIDDAVTTLADTTAWGELGTYEAALALARQKTCILSRFQMPEQTAASVTITPAMEGENKKAVDMTASDDSAEVRRDKVAVTSSLMALAGGISKVVDYYNANHSDSPIEKMYVTGVGADFSGISELLSNEIGFKIRNLTNISGVNIEKSFKEVSFGEYVACVGAAMAPVHFSSDREEEKGKGKGKGKTDTMMIAVVACGLCMLVGVIMIVMSLVPYLSEKKKQKEYNAIIEELQPVYEVYLKYQSLSSQAAQMKALDAETINRNQEMVAFIETLEAKMPASFALNDLAATTEGITMNVTVETKEEAAVVLEELRKLDSFIFVDTTSLSELITEIGETQYSFAVAMTYAPMEEETIEEGEE